MLPNLGPMEMIIVMGIAVLLFGKRLPEVGRSLGKGIVEFKKGLSDVTSGLDDASISSYSSPYQSAPKTYDAPKAEATYTEAAPKFEVPGAASTTAATGAVEYQPPASN
ncbi:Sec-independent protein translocase subunit TatA/TatB [Paludisphaera borealis]|uniref:Sec-independent protein translocase protein TatA n=1 Tax=Paludisphaera borealis TaxID=1387353 RepID=A0A1U7CQU5_9BACT|nr:twin-arginine translocase TatA/TatE family subunit [Paludisphaera borealis]APW61278.1 Sec-independent protein translocase protein TatA [Paludisphaera borealis]